MIETTTLAISAARCGGRVLGQLCGTVDVSFDNIEGRRVTFVTCGGVIDRGRKRQCAKCVLWRTLTQLVPSFRTLRANQPTADWRLRVPTTPRACYTPKNDGLMARICIQWIRDLECCDPFRPPNFSFTRTPCPWFRNPDGSDRTKCCSIKILEKLSAVARPIAHEQQGAGTGGLRSCTGLDRTYE